MFIEIVVVDRKWVVAPSFKFLIQLCDFFDWQVVGGSQGAQVKLSDGSVKTVTAAAAGHLSKPGTTTLRMTGGVITAASSTPGSVSAAAAAAASQQQASFTALMFFYFIPPDSWFEITFMKGQRALTLKWILSI